MCPPRRSRTPLPTRTLLASLPQTSVFFSGIVTALDGDVAHVVFGQSGSEWVWVKDAAEPGVTVMHCLGFRATLQVRGAPRVWASRTYI